MLFRNPLMSWAIPGNAVESSRRQAASYKVVVSQEPLSVLSSICTSLMTGPYRRGSRPRPRLSWQQKKHKQEKKKKHTKRKNHPAKREKNATNTSLHEWVCDRSGPPLT